MSLDVGKLLTVVALSLAIPAMTHAQSTYVKVADEWGTIRAGGPRPPQFGNRNWNIAGVDNGANASTGTLRFYMADFVTRLNADFPGGWQIDKVTLVVEHDDAAFSLAGPVDVFHMTDDAVAITNGEDSTFMGGPPDAAPGNFGPLEPSTLIFDDSVVGKTSGGSLGTLTLVNNYTFAAQGDQNLDVLGTPDNLVDPTGATNITPDYMLSFPAANAPDETLATFATELAADAGDWIPAGLDTLIADLEDGTDALSLLFSPGDATVDATYKGNPFGTLFPPRIYIQASSTGPADLIGDYNDNGTVDAADYVLWRKGGPLQNEGDTPGVVNEADYTVWRANFGESVPGSGAGLETAAVPEPLSAALLVMGMAFLASIRRDH